MMYPPNQGNYTIQPPQDTEIPGGGDDDVPLGDPYHKSTEEYFKPPEKFEVKHFHRVHSLIRDDNFHELLKIIREKKKKPVNLMNDPLLSVVISAKKTELAVKLIEEVSLEKLKESNCNEDTPLHTAAAEGDTAVAEALLERDWELVEEVNSKGETPLHKAAIYGNESMFWCLVRKGKMEEARYARRDDGSTVLHCAIMGNASKLALDIARNFPSMIESRNSMAATPLQLMVTIPNSFKSQLVLDPLESFLYDWVIPLPEDSRSRNAAADEEAGRSVNVASTDDDDGVEQYYGGKWESVRSKFPSQYSTILDLMEFTGSWLRKGVLKILKQVFQNVKTLEELKKRHKEAMQLVQHLAQSDYYDFYSMGYTGSGDSKVLHYAMRIPSTLSDNPPEEATLKPLQMDKGKEHAPMRWNEPPLITGAKLGLHDFVRKILQVCPQSVMYMDSNGISFLQVAIQSGHKEVVSVISEMLQGSNPILPSHLCSMLDNESRNTILHLAAENSPAEEGDALQLHHELKWFEMVEKIVPKELVYSRNNKERTAHELFTERHKKTLQSCKDQLVEMGKTCAGLVAAVVFTSSFSLPDTKQNESGKLAFTILSHAYVIGFASAATSLVLFLSLAITPYKERDFRRVIPMQFALSFLSFALALVAFLLSFVCSFILQIYGGELNTKHLIPLILELVLFPVTCFTVLLYHGAKFGPFFSQFWK